MGVDEGCGGDCDGVVAVVVGLGLVGPVAGLAAAVAELVVAAVDAGRCAKDRSGGFVVVIVVVVVVVVIAGQSVVGSRAGLQRVRRTLCFADAVRYR